MVVPPPCLTHLSCPNVPDPAFTRVASLGHPLLVELNLLHQRFKEPADDPIRIGVVGQLNTLRQAEIHSEDQNPRRHDTFPLLPAPFKRSQYQIMPSFAAIAELGLQT